MAGLLKNAHKMRVYSIHLNPKSKNIFENAVFISEQFNFFAFLFTGFWALANRLWLVAFAIFVGQYAIMLVAQTLGISVIGVVLIDIAVRFLLGLCGNDLWQAQLKHRGYVLSDVIVANNHLEAAHRYYGRHITEINQPNLGAKLVEC